MNSEGHTGWFTSVKLILTESVEEEVLRYFTEVNVEIQWPENTELQLKVLHAKCYLCKSTEVLTTKCIESVKKIKVFIMQKGSFQQWWKKY